MRFLLPLVWFALAAWFIFGAPGDRAEVLGALPRAPRIDPVAIDGAPRRTPLGEPPAVRIGGVEQRCSDCHALFASLDVTPSGIRQHGNIVFDHGENDRCYNCHSQANQNRLILRDGRELPFPSAAELCAECHGTLYRDWQRGMHGKTSGSWDALAAEHRRFTCCECHDPHTPAFPPLQALPGPNTWRFGKHTRDAADGAEQVRNPLERWKVQGRAR
jgi:hypothetical protein